ncbi:TRAP transporter small permease [Paracidovorax sp. MALMAid1276]|uniref:TRAP transporter small permease n=1 Tax=Paracidovorax sp. MALMAid1276 TaxID=3411631 RepID=UPI003B9A3393
MSDTSLDHLSHEAPLRPTPVPLPLPLYWLGKVVDGSVICIGAFMITLVFVNVVLHAFGKDLAWVTELGELLMVWVTFLGGASAAQRGAHMTITEFLDKLDPAGRRLADMAVQLVCLVVLTFLLYYGWRIVAESWNNTLTTLLWPMAWQYMPLPLGAGLMLVFTAWDFVLTLRGVPRDHRYPADE